MLVGRGSHAFGTHKAAAEVSRRRLRAQAGRRKGGTPRRSGADVIGAVLDSITRSTTWLVGWWDVSSPMFF